MKKILLFSIVLLISVGLNAQTTKSLNNETGAIAMFKKNVKKWQQKNLLEKRETKNTFASTKAIINYNLEEEDGTFSSINSTGTAITPSDWDDGEATLDLTGTYNFTFNLKNYSIYRIGCNGGVILGSTSDDLYASNDLGGSITPIVAPLWDDLRFYDEGSGQGLFYQIDTLSNDTVLTIEWYNVEKYSYQGNFVSFQVKFHSNGNIEFVYGDMSQAANWAGSASIGINDTEGGSTAFASITPGSPAAISYTEANNTIDQSTIAAIPSGKIYRLVPNFHTYDLLASDISPLNITPNTDADMSVSVTNIGTSDASNYTVSLAINDGTNDVYTSSRTISDVLATGEDTTITLDTWTSVPAGYYSATFTITYSSDEDTSNNIVTKDIVAAEAYTMDNETDTVCLALFYDSGADTAGYASNEDYTMTFVPSAPNKWLQVEFTMFDVEGEPFDYLEIYDGTSTSAPKIAQYGDENPNGIIKASNPDGALTFHFVSDGSVQYDGWEAAISCFDPPQHDLSVSQINPTFISSGSAVQPQITIANGAVNDENSYQLWYTNKDGSYTGTQSFSDNIPALSTGTVSLPSWTPTGGLDTLTVAVILSGDEDNSNDTLSQAIYIGSYQDVYGGNTTKTTYYSIEEATGDTTNVGTISTDPFPMAEEFANNTIYRVYSDLTFGTVTPNGDFNQLGTLSGISGTPTGLAYNWFTRTLYVAVLDAGNVPHICTVNLSTLEVTEVSTAEGMIIGMDFANDGFLYAATIDNNQVIKVNPTTGETTVIGDIGININYGQDLSYDVDSNKLYTITCGDVYKYGTYDLTTGAFTEIKDMGSDQYGTFVITKELETYAVNFTVTDGTNPLANAQIQVGNIIINTDAAGLATLYLPNDNYTAITSLFGFENDTTSFTVAGADQNITITLNALPTYNITFHVANVLSTDLANANILVMYGTDTITSGQTDGSGLFNAGALYPYDCRGAGGEKTRGKYQVSC
jgi:hypothetical protein